MEEVAKGQHLPPTWEAKPPFFMCRAVQWDMHARQRNPSGPIPMLPQAQSLQRLLVRFWLSSTELLARCRYLFLRGRWHAFRRMQHFDFYNNPNSLTGMPHGGSLQVQHLQNERFAWKSCHPMGGPPSVEDRRSHCSTLRLISNLATGSESLLIKSTHRYFWYKLTFEQYGPLPSKSKETDSYTKRRKDTERKEANMRRQNRREEEWTEESKSQEKRRDAREERTEEMIEKKILAKESCEAEFSALCGSLFLLGHLCITTPNLLQFHISEILSACAILLQ